MRYQRENTHQVYLSVSLSLPLKDHMGVGTDGSVRGLGWFGRKG
jgi:hypothetical protein